MRSGSRSVGLAVLSLSLLGLAGCAEENDKAVTADSAGKTTVAEKKSYGQMAPKAPGGNPYGTAYPGAKAAPKAN